MKREYRIKEYKEKREMFYYEENGMYTNKREERNENEGKKE